MQYREGSCSLTNGSATVTGSNTLWSTEVEAGDAFILVGEGVIYDIASVVSNTELQLTAPYAGVTATGVQYAITSDFTSDGIPELSQGDVESASIFTRAMRRIQEVFNDSDITNAGTAITEDVMTSLTDTTAGRLMPVGAFGLGGSNGAGLPGNDANNGINPGFYQVTSNTANTAFGGTSVLMVERSFNVIVQKQSSGSRDAYERRSTDSGTTWGSWSLKGAQVVGAVSQSGGVPTGAIIERGSNANGEYVKFADGTMWLSGITTVDFNTDSPQSATLPSSVVAGSVRGVSHVADSGTVGGNTDSRLYLLVARATTTGFTFQIRYEDATPAPAVATADIIWSVLARWF